MVQGHLQDAPLRIVAQDGGCPLDSQPLDEAEQGLAGDGPEYAMEVKRRERGQSRQAGQREVLAQVLAHVVDHPVHPAGVLEPAGASHCPGGYPTVAAAILDPNAAPR